MSVDNHEFSTIIGLSRQMEIKLEPSDLPHLKYKST